jgi:hypothetical protein
MHLLALMVAFVLHVFEPHAQVFGAAALPAAQAAPVSTQTSAGVDPWGGSGG